MWRAQRAVTRRPGRRPLDPAGARGALGGRGGAGAAGAAARGAVGVGAGAAAARTGPLRRRLPGIRCCEPMALADARGRLVDRLHRGAARFAGSRRRGRRRASRRARCCCFRRRRSSPPWGRPSSRSWRVNSPCWVQVAFVAELALPECSPPWSGLPVVRAALVDFLAGAFVAFFAAAGWAVDFRAATSGPPISAVDFWAADFLAGAFAAVRTVFCGAAARATSGTGSAAPERVPERVLRLAGGMPAVWHGDDHHHDGKGQRRRRQP